MKKLSLVALALFILCYVAVLSRSAICYASGETLKAVYFIAAAILLKLMFPYERGD